MNENDIAKVVVNVCYQIHRELGPGLFESVYEEILYEILIDMGYSVKRQYPIPVIYKGKHYNLGFRADLIINDSVLIELKSVDKLHHVHFKQTLTYVKLSNLKLGLLINFNEALVKDGIKRIVNNL
jgi:GxxExxY protein